MTFISSPWFRFLSRIKQLVEEKTTPKNRDEQEIAGYRDVLNIIHEDFDAIPITQNYILHLHKILYSHMNNPMGGKTKNVQNYISATYPDGHVETLFTLLSPFETPEALDKICEEYNRVIGNMEVEPLIIIPIHRDYIVLGSEIHIDMFDDRVEITSPGGMFGGGSIQEYDIYSIRSMRRNPVIADLFHRMKYMERRGSGLRQIVSETEKLPGYTAAYKPEFTSTATDFRGILKNVNYNLEGDSHQVIHQVIELSTVSKQILAFCTTPKSKKELAVFCGFKDLRNFTLKHINPLLKSRQLEMTIPDKPKSRNQKYITVRSE